MVALLGAAVLLFRGSHTYCGELQDTRGDVAFSCLDDGTPVITATVAREPALLASRRFVGEQPSALAGYQFVSEIFRPPIAPLARS
jgi:hypothetical protein